MPLRFSLLRFLCKLLFLMLGYEVVSHWVVWVDVRESGRDRGPFRYITLTIIFCMISSILRIEREAREKHTYEIWFGVQPFGLPVYPFTIDQFFLFVIFNMVYS